MRACLPSRPWTVRALFTLLVVLLVTALVVTPATPAQAACDRGRVALTFDDGPTGHITNRLLTVLENRRARATFFVMGRAVNYRRWQTRKITNKGHRILNHTWSHPDLTNLSRNSIKWQVRRTQRAISDAGTRTIGKVVRPPYGAVDTRVRNVLSSIGFRTVLWTVDTRDWSSSTTADQIVARVKRGLKPGANILMHDQSDAYATVRALPRVITAVRSRGYCLGVINRNGKVAKP